MFLLRRASPLVCLNWDGDASISIMLGVLAMWFVLAVAVPVVGIAMIVTRANGMRARLQPWRLEVGLLIASVVFAALAAAVMLFAPLGANQSTTISATGEFVRSAIARVSILSPGVFVVAVIGVVVACAPLCILKSNARQTAEYVAGVLLFAVVVITGFSVGVLLLPAAVLMMLAAGAGVATATTSSPRA